MTEEKSKDKFKAGQTFLIGLAFFTTFSWSLYNSQVNRALNSASYFGALVLSGLVVGSIMAIDNVIACIPEPATLALLGFGGLSLIRKRR